MDRMDRADQRRLSSRAADQAGPTRTAEREDLEDVGPVAVSLEDDLAAVAAKHDLDVPPPDRLRVAAADGTGSRLFHVHRRNRIDLECLATAFILHLPRCCLSL